MSVLSKERLTERRNGRGFCPENIECTPKCEDCEHMGKMMDKLAEYEDLEEQGLILRLPCKVGDTVYKPNFIAGKVHEIKITVLNLYESEIGIGINGLVDNKQMFYCRPEDFGKSVFLTQSEAEEKLRELNKESEE